VEPGTGPASKAEVKIICPRCAGEVSPSETLWVWQTKWYCSERCARLASGQGI